MLFVAFTHTLCPFPHPFVIPAKAGIQPGARQMPYSTDGTRRLTDLPLFGSVALQQPVHFLLL